MSGIRFPQLPAAYLGPQQAYTKLGMNTISNKDPLIHCTSGAIEVSYPAVTYLLTLSVFTVSTVHGGNPNQLSFIICSAYTNSC